VTEAMKLAFADRDHSVADPRRTACRNWSPRFRPPAPGPDPILQRLHAAHIGAGGNTDFVAVIDGERNMVSITPRFRRASAT
jgi:gamma-glutamyltranspeptidase